MRPVSKPASHPGYTDGKPYNDAQQPLAHCLGGYCSYCERVLPSKAEVEHKRPKSLNPALETTWSNFLLSCGNCNAPKSNRNAVYLKDANGKVWTEIIPGTYLTWPDDLFDAEDYDRDTFNMIEYLEDGTLRPSPKIPYQQDTDRVIATLAIVNLGHVLNSGYDIGNLWFEKAPGKFENAKSAMGYQLTGAKPQASLMQRYKPDNTPNSVHVSKSVPDSLRKRASLGTAGATVKDFRVMQRQEAWKIAHHQRAYFDAMVIGNFVDATKNLGGSAQEQFQTLTKKQARRQVTQMRYAVRDNAKSKGFWSIWITAFKGGTPLPDFQTRHAVVPVLKTLLRREHFPGTRANNEFMPPIYDDTDTAWVDAVYTGRLDPFFELEQAKSDVENLTDTVDTLEDDLEEARKDAVKLRKEKSDLATNLSKTTTLLTQTRTERNNVTQERDDLNNQVADLQRRLNDCIQRQANYRRERNNARAQRDAALQEVRRLTQMDTS